MLNLTDRLAQLPAPARRLLDHSTATALALGTAPYLVGGSVRDLLLGRTTLDLDVVVVGDALAVAAALQETLGGTLHTHPAFGTAKLVLPEGTALDLITARHEHYPAPGALPVVTPSTLADDLQRRDFTINALALDLRPASFGALVDPLGGLADLRAGLVRVLHDASFHDDPTRILRAIRYAGRLATTHTAFALEPRTTTHLRHAIANRALRTVSVDRLTHEFIRLLAESAADIMLTQLAAFDVLPQIGTELRWDTASVRAYDRLETLWPFVVADSHNRHARWEGRFALLIAHLPEEAAHDAAAALHLPAHAVHLVAEVPRVAAIARSLPLGISNAALGHHFDACSAAAVAVVAATLPADATATTLVRYLNGVRLTVPHLTGLALRQLRVPPGPIYRQALTALRDCKRDEPGLTHDEEWAFLIGWLRTHGALPGE